MNYVVIGAGPAGVLAAETLRKTDAQGKITLIGGEDERPYSRMAIPYYLEGNIPEEGMHLRKSEDHFQKLNIEVLKGRKVSKVEPQGKQVVLDNGESHSFDKLLLATGSQPFRPPIPGLDQEGIHTCWTIEDARHIKGLLSQDCHVVLIGAGFIGTIILDALGSQKLTLTVVEAETHMTPRMMNVTGGEVIKNWCNSKNVRVLTSTKVEAVESGGTRKFSLKLNNGETLPADVVVTATGVKPPLAYLEGSGISTDEGILVNAHLQTNLPDIYAAGDCAQGINFSTGGFSVHAIQPTAADHGRIAALNMAGQPTAYMGSLIMNVIATLGLTTYSFGQWEGAEGGEHGEYLDEEKSRYIRLEFKDDYLVGAIYIGALEHIGILRGLIQNRIPLGEWKAKLIHDPRKLMKAYLVLTEFGKSIPLMTPKAG